MLIYWNSYTANGQFEFYFRSGNPIRRFYLKKRIRQIGLRPSIPLQTFPLANVILIKRIYGTSITGNSIYRHFEIMRYDQFLRQLAITQSVELTLQFFCEGLFRCKTRAINYREPCIEYAHAYEAINYKRDNYDFLRKRVTRIEQSLFIAGRNEAETAREFTMTYRVVSFASGTRYSIKT